MKKFRFSIDMILESKVNFLLSVILASIGFFLIGLTFLVYLAGSYGRESAENVLAQGIGQTGILSRKDFDLPLEDNFKKFRKAAFESEQIYSIGSVRTQGFVLEHQYFSELCEIRNEHNIKKNLPVETDLPALRVDLEVFNISDMSL